MKIGFPVAAALLAVLSGCYVMPRMAEEPADSLPARPAAPPSHVHSGGAEPKDEISFAVPEGRLMRFHAWVELEAANVGAALASARKVVEAAGGYVKSMDNSGAVLRIPVDRAQASLAALEALGVVTSRRTVAEDVTTEVTDLEIRLDNLEALRKRLTALLDKAELIEDMLKIENELSRVTLELEQLQGLRKLLQNQIDFVTVNLTVTAAPPLPAVQETLPVGWVERMGGDILRPAVASENARDARLPFRIDLPPEFVLVSSGPRRAVAVNADGVTIRYSEMDNLPGGTVEFWKKLLARARPDNGPYGSLYRDYLLEIELPINDRAISGGTSMEVRDKVMIYRYVLVVEDDVLRLIESWGADGAYLEAQEAIEASYPSLCYGWRRLCPW